MWLAASILIKINLLRHSKSIFILGGLLAMYEFLKIKYWQAGTGKRLLPAFSSPTGIPYYWVNLKSGEVKGDTVNMAEGGTNLIEMGMLSRFTGNPAYFEAAKKASLAIHNRRSEIGLVGESINVRTGTWTDTVSHIGCCIDSYYEYLYKGWLLFQDQDIKNAWDQSITAIQKYIADEVDSSLWYCRVSMNTGRRIDRVVSLYDAYFPAVLALSGDLKNAARYQDSWNHLWLQYDLNQWSMTMGKKILSSIIT
jgi:hypothetical protein